VNGHRELAQVDAVIDGVGHLLDEVGGVQPHDVARDDLGRVLAEDDLARGGKESVTPRAGAEASGGGPRKGLSGAVGVVCACGACGA
jgi:hypothetical protein